MLTAIASDGSVTGDGERSCDVRAVLPTSFPPATIFELRAQAKIINKCWEYFVIYCLKTETSSFGVTLAVFRWFENSVTFVGPNISRGLDLGLNHALY